MTIIDKPENPATELIEKFYSELLTLEQLQNVPEPSWLVENFLMLDSVSVIWGDPGSGKSFVALDIAMSVACGRHWFNNTTKPGKVLYVLGEGTSGMRKRANAWVSYHGLRPDAEDIMWLPHMPDFFDGLTVDALTSVVAEYSIDLVVIDTLARAMVGKNENDNADMGRFVQAAEKIRDARRDFGKSVTVLLVHHSTKSPRGLQSMRGSSVLRGGIDTEMELQRVDPEPGSPNTMRELICNKQKDAPEFETVNVHMWERHHSLIPMPLSDLPTTAL